MQVQGTYYQDGRLIFHNPVKLRRYPIKVEVLIPDKEVERPESAFEIDRKEVEITSPELLQMVRQIREIQSGRYTYRDDGRTDKDRFAEELEAYYK